jgi:hypothetical protein
MAESVYKDRLMALRGRRFGLLDPGREIGAIANLLCNADRPPSWQERALLDKLLSIIRGRRHEGVTVFLSSCRFSFELRSLCFALFSRIGKQLSLVSCVDIDFGDPVNKIDAYVIDYLEKNLRKVPIDYDPNIVDTNDKFVVWLISSEDRLAQELALESFGKSVKGVILIKDFSLATTKFYAELFRSAGLSITESADGFGECWRL